jgi:hypothetical protein
VSDITITLKSHPRRITGQSGTRSLGEHVFVFKLTNTAATRQRAGTFCSKQACPCARETPPGRVLYPSARTIFQHLMPPAPERGLGCRDVPARQVPNANPVAASTILVLGRPVQLRAASACPARGVCSEMSYQSPWKILTVAPSRSSFRQVVTTLQIHPRIGLLCLPPGPV